MNGKTFSVSRDEIKAQNPSGHSPVVIGGKLKANDGIYPVGLILKRDVDGITLIPFVEGDTPTAVLDQTIDTAVEGSGNIVIHGGVQVSALKVGVAVPAEPSQATLLALQVHGIFPA
ncbi:MAG: hypothetical protein PVSMB11_03710 [Desulfuromonadaceae bacterium]